MLSIPIFLTRSIFDNAGIVVLFTVVRNGQPLTRLTVLAYL